MNGMRVSVSPGALLIFALSLFFDPCGAVSALIPAAAAHEAGHIIAMLAYGIRLERLRIDIFGLRLDYAGLLSGRRELICAAAGPGAGLLYAAACFAVGGDFFSASGMMSLLLTCFNLLPALPLDGGRIVLAVRGRAAAERLSIFSSLSICLAGAVLLLRFGEPAPLVLGAWLLCALRGKA